MPEDQRDGQGEGEVGHAGVDSSTPFLGFGVDEFGVGAEEGDVGLAVGEGLQAAVDGVGATDPGGGGDGGGEEEEHTCGEFTEHDLHPMVQL